MNDLMLRVLVIAIAANVVLVVVAVIRSRMVRPRGDFVVASAAMASPDGLAAPIAIAAMPGAPADPAPDEPAAEPPEVDASLTGEEPDMSANQDEPMRPRRFRMPEDDDYPTDESVHAFLDSGPWAQDPVEDLFDEQTGLRSGLAWDEAIGHEEARRSRYGHAVTVVVVELDRLDALARQLGRENADRLIKPVARALLVNARAADVVARLGHHRFGVLLPETDEIRAINYVERVRLACDAWLEAAAVSVRLAIGWASAPTGGDLAAAFVLAERRMNADRSSTRADALPTAAVPTAAPPVEAAPAPVDISAASPSAAVPDTLAADQSDAPSPTYVAWGGPASDLGAG